MSYLENLASHGRSWKTDHSPAPQLTLVLTGTLRPTKSHWQQPRKISTSRWRNFGLGNQHTHLKTWRNSMVSSFTCVWSYPWGEHTSQSSNRCWGFSTIVLSYHTPALRDFEQTWSGGSANFNSPSSWGQSLSLFPSTMLEPFQTRAQNSALLSSLAISGEPGISSQAGGHWKDSEILAGQKPLLSNAWSDISLIAKHGSGTSLYMGTTGELSKGGGTEGATTERLTKSSRDFMFFPSRARARLLPHSICQEQIQSHRWTL